MNGTAEDGSTLALDRRLTEGLNLLHGRLDALHEDVRENRRDIKQLRQELWDGLKEAAGERGRLATDLAGLRDEESGSSVAEYRGNEGASVERSIVSRIPLHPPAEVCVAADSAAGLRRARAVPGSSRMKRVRSEASPRASVSCSAVPGPGRSETLERVAPLPPTTEGREGRRRGRDHPARGTAEEELRVHHPGRAVLRPRQPRDRGDAGRGRRPGHAGRVLPVRTFGEQASLRRVARARRIPLRGGGHPGLRHRRRRWPTRRPRCVSRPFRTARWASAVPSPSPAAGARGSPSTGKALPVRAFEEQAAVRRVAPGGGVQGSVGQPRERRCSHRHRPRRISRHRPRSGRNSPSHAAARRGHKRDVAQRRPAQVESMGTIGGVKFRCAVAQRCRSEERRSLPPGCGSYSSGVRARASNRR